MEDGQQGRKGGQHGEYGQTEMVAERPLGVVQVRQRDEERDDQYFQPDGHGCSESNGRNVSLRRRSGARRGWQQSYILRRTRLTAVAVGLALARTNVLREPASVYFCLAVGIDNLTLHRLLDVIFTDNTLVLLLFYYLQRKWRRNNRVISIERTAATAEVSQFRTQKRQQW